MNGAAVTKGRGHEAKVGDLRSSSVSVPLPQTPRRQNRPLPHHKKHTQGLIASIQETGSLNVEESLGETGSDAPSRPRAGGGAEGWRRVEQMVPGAKQSMNK